MVLTSYIICTSIFKYLFHLPTLMHNFLFINNIYVTLQSSTCFEHQHDHFRRTNCIITASGIVTLCKWLYSMPEESRLLCSLLSSGIMYCTVQRVTIPDVVIIQFVLLKMGMLMLETCRGL